MVGGRVGVFSLEVLGIIESDISLCCVIFVFVNFLFFL